MDVSEIEERLADLRAELASVEALIPPIEAELGPAERRLEAAQRDYDEAARGFARAWSVTAGGWRPRDDREGDRALRAIEQAKARQIDAEEPLQAALVARNNLNARRGGLWVHRAALRTRLEQAEAELARTREIAERVAADEAGTLGRIRARLGV